MLLKPFRIENIHIPISQGENYINIGKEGK